MDGHYQFNKRFNPTYDIFRYVLYTSTILGFTILFMVMWDCLIFIINRLGEVLWLKKNDIKLKKVLKDMSYSNHIEDIMADDREILIKLVKQTNSIVDYLKQLE